MKKTDEWGKWFPISISPFAFNHSTAMDELPLSRQEALKRGYKWEDEIQEINIPQKADTIKAEDLPDNIDDIPDNITKKVIICKTSGRPYTIQKMELAFCKRMGIPIPRQHPEIRQRKRFRYYKKPKLYKRNCYKCNKDIWTTYTKDDPYKVLCEKCYNKTIL